MSGSYQDLFGPTTVIDYATAAGDKVTFYSPVFPLTDVNTVALRLRVYGILQNTKVDVDLETANDLTGADWTTVGTGITQSTQGNNDQLWTNADGTGTEFMNYGRATITCERLTSAGDYGAMFQVAAVLRECS